MKKLFADIVTALGVAELLLPVAAQHSVHGALEFWAGPQTAPAAPRALTG